MIINAASERSEQGRFLSNSPGSSNAGLGRRSVRRVRLEHGDDGMHYGKNMPKLLIGMLRPLRVYLVQETVRIVPAALQQHVDDVSEDLRLWVSREHCVDAIARGHERLNIRNPRL